VKKLKEILRSRRGASYIIVLAVTAFLLLLAAAALTAASSAGESVADRVYKEMGVAADSVSDNLMYSLQSETETLGPGIVKGLYDSQYPADGSAAVTPGWEMTVSLPAGALPEGAAVSAIKLAFTDLSVSYSQAIAGRAALYDESGKLVSAAIKAKPAGAKVGAVMTASYTITYLEKTVTVTDVFALTGAELADTGTGSAAAMTVAKRGEWRLTSHEKNG